MKSIHILGITTLLMGGSSGLLAQQTPPPIVRTNVAPVIRYGTWIVQDGDDYFGTYTENTSGSVFGLLCGKTCLGYLNIQLSCENGKEYPAMINSDAGSYSVILKCHIFDGRYLLSMAADSQYFDVLNGGGEVGFAVPMKSGKFAVSRFALTGAKEAVGVTLDRVLQRRDSEQEGLRDFEI